MAQNDRKLYDSLFQLRVRAFDRSLQHRGGSRRRKGRRRRWRTRTRTRTRRRDLLRLSLSHGSPFIFRRSERRATDFSCKIVLGAIKGHRQSPCLMTFAQPTARDICARVPLRAAIAPGRFRIRFSVLFSKGSARGRTFRDKNNTLFS